MRANRRRTRSFTDLASEYFREKTALGRRTASFIDELRTRRVPVHWTNFFGAVTIASIAVLIVTGIVLVFFYEASSEQRIYDGSYAPLVGQPVSHAFDSVMTLSFAVPGGLLLRQLHHWAGLLAPAAIMVQLLVTFFTGAFRRPRRGSWVALFLLLAAVLAAGWSGYALPDDSLSSTGLRIVQGIVLAIPVIGTWLSAMFFGGAFPGRVIEVLYPLHVLIAPAAIVALIALRTVLAHRTGPPQFAAGGRTEGNVVGIPLLPSAATRALGLSAIVVGILIGVASTVQITPVWIYGPAEPSVASAGSQPDWYTGFLDGALRLVPPGWEVVIFGRTVTLALLVPLVVVGVFLLAVAVYPFLEEWISKDKTDHHILDRPRNVATRTGVGAAGVAFYGILWLAASADIIALIFKVALEGVLATLQVALLVGPHIAFAATRRACLGLQRRDRDTLDHGYETGRITRLPGGEYVEEHRHLDDQERWRRSNGGRPSAVDARPREDGRLTLAERLRAALAKHFYLDRIEWRPTSWPTAPPFLPPKRNAVSMRRGAPTDVAASDGTGNEPSREVA